MKGDEVFLQEVTGIFRWREEFVQRPGGRRKHEKSGELNTGLHVAQSSDRSSAFLIIYALPKAPLGLLLSMIEGSSSAFHCLCLNSLREGM